MCAEDKWKEFLDWAKTKKNCYFIGMGDYDDLASTSEREILRNPHLHDSTKDTLEEMYTKHVDRFYKEISFMKGRLVGLIEGNHYSVFSSGITTTQLLALRMGCKYLGVSSFIRLVLKKGEHHAHNLDVWAHHGLGGGRTLGASINKLEQMYGLSTARINLMGHDHKKQIALRNRFTLMHVNNGSVTLEDQKVLLARTGSFLKGYVENKASYVVDSCMPSLDLGVVKIEITPRRKDYGHKIRTEQRWLDIHASI